MPGGPCWINKKEYVYVSDSGIMYKENINQDPIIQIIKDERLKDSVITFDGDKNILYVYAKYKIFQIDFNDNNKLQIKPWTDCNDMNDMNHRQIPSMIIINNQLNMIGNGKHLIWNHETKKFKDIDNCFKRGVYD